jgi:hypothetical protein
MLVSKRGCVQACFLQSIRTACLCVCFFINEVNCAQLSSYNLTAPSFGLYVTISALTNLNLTCHFLLHPTLVHTIAFVLTNWHTHLLYTHTHTHTHAHTHTHTLIHHTQRCTHAYTHTHTHTYPPHTFAHTHTQHTHCSPFVCTSRRQQGCCRHCKRSKRKGL